MSVSHHVVGQEILPEEDVRFFQQCALDGQAHGAKVVLSIDSKEKDILAHEAALFTCPLIEKEGKSVIPNFSLFLGTLHLYCKL